MLRSCGCPVFITMRELRAVYAELAEGSPGHWADSGVSGSLARDD